LGIITFFVLAFILQTHVFSITRMVKIAVISFIIGVVLNEALLMLQGVGGIVGVFVPHIPIALGIAAAIMLIALIGLVKSIVNNRAVT